MISHGCIKAEAAAAEQLIKSLIAQSEEDAPFCPLPSAAVKGRATVAPASTSASPRDANAALAASAAESETPVAAAKESGGASARASTAKVVNAAGMTSSPRDAKEVVDYSMFEQIWMSDLTAAVPKAV